MVFFVQYQRWIVFCDTRVLSYTLRFSKTIRLDLEQKSTFITEKITEYE